ncbi:TPA: collagenase-like protease [Candidatus Sumerlaeota bacterium]|jgi:23S rRNA 5-hydroxycytidine C2501 synthase|nr:collagenase-like protease [Candidatus Sumerlaeota bacterium]
MPPIELLAPAKDLPCGIAAINCGADAVYIGAPRFSAREAAGNTLEDIRALADYAHKYWAKVYVALNTLLRDDEIPLAEKLIEQLFEAEVDGLIIQDVGLLECNLPPMPLIASTQMHNNTPEKVAFLEQVGFQRAILARELTLDEIRAIRKAAPKIELEFFVHGALCVSYSGQCYLSYGLGGRSGNRGQCAQPCRKMYKLVDGQNHIIAEKKHLLSLRDLNLSECLNDLLNAGITSFKIEGRLKDHAYVSNTVTAYRAKLDELLPKKNLERSSAGISVAEFIPNLDKTFNRGYTTYFLHGLKESIGSIDTPKMLGEPVGKAIDFTRDGVKLDARNNLHAGDGLCFFDKNGVLRGTFINAVHGPIVVPDKKEGIEMGTRFYRNHDHDYLMRLKKAKAERRVAVHFTLRNAHGGLKLTVIDENKNRVQFFLASELAPAEKPDMALANIRKQLEKTGGSDYTCTKLDIALDEICFVPVSTLNALRRGALEELDKVRVTNYELQMGHAEIIKNDVPYPQKELTYLGNVLNKQAEAFYKRHGVTKIEPAAESGTSMQGRKVMTTRYCIKQQLGLCPKTGAAQNFTEPLSLIDEDDNMLDLRFDCAKCQMEIYLGGKR